MDLRRLGALLRRPPNAANPGEPEEQVPDPDPEPEPVPVPAPPPAPRVRGGAGMVDWWAARNAGIQEPDDEGCKHPNPRTVQVNGLTVPFWCPDCRTELHFDAPSSKPRASQPAAETVEDVDADDQEGADDEPGEYAEPTARRRWDPRGSGKKAYLRPAYGARPAPRQSLIEWWAGISAPSRWLLYNGTALGIGFTLGVPQFFTRETAFLVAHHHSWTDLYVCFWYGVAVLAVVIDRKTRTWLPPFALAGRVPLISLLIGALLYGTPTLPA